MDIGPEWSKLTLLTFLSLTAKLRDCSNISYVSALQALDLNCLQVTAPNYQGPVHPVFRISPGSLTGLTKLAVTIHDVIQVISVTSYISYAKMTRRWRGGLQSGLSF